MKMNKLTILSPTREQTYASFKILAYIEGVMIDC